MKANAVSIVDDRNFTSETKIHAQPERGHRSIVEARITSGQLEAVALRFRVELDDLLQRSGKGEIATLDKGILSVEIEHSLSAAKHNLMRQASSRDLFQQYLEELAEQISPTLIRHIEDILPVTVTYSEVQIASARDSIIFAFGVRTKICWTESMVEANIYRDYA